MATFGFDSDISKVLVNTTCNIITVGQYLQPSSKHWPVDRYVSPKQFEVYKKVGLKMGFDIVESGPLVRSSYHAEKHV